MKKRKKMKKQKEIRDQNQISLEGQILASRERIQETLVDLLELQDEKRMKEFQRSLLKFYQQIRVYIEKSNQEYDILEKMDQESLKGISISGNEEDLEKWLEYYHELERVLFDIGITNILKANTISA